MIKILFTRNETFANECLADAVFHGLLQLGDIEVTDDPMLWYMYADGRPGTGKYKSHTELHGKGFGNYRLIGDDSHIDRSDTESRIKNQYYDLVILARSDFGSPYEELILQHYPPNRVIILCGKDQPDLYHYRDSTHLLGKGTYFKRELYFSHPQIKPISFAFPKEKILDRTGLKKEKLLAGVQVAASGESPQTFFYDKDYYTEYAKSRFGETWKKGGWDCVRHYEIMASGCVPWFKDIMYCPEQTCTTLPKEELLAVCGLINEHGVDWFETEIGDSIYQELQSSIFSHFLKNCTTDILAKYVLDTHRQNFQ